MIQTVAAPVNARQMLLDFALFDPAAGLGSLLNRIDFTGVSRRQIIYSTQGRAPERAGQVRENASFNPRIAAAAALQDDAFQTRIREIILNAFPEKRRLIFIHVPKCAGTDLLVTLRRLYPYLHQHMAATAQTQKVAFFELLRQFAVGINLADTIAISGHVPLKWYLDRALLRFEDEVFTTIRHPRDIIYSYISFILTRCVEFIDAKRADTAGWLAAIGLTRLEANPSAAYLADIGRQVLRARTLMRRNVLCHHLGANTAASAIEAMVLTNMEITDTTRYSAWRRAKFGYEPPKRVNMSQPFFTPAIATEEDRALVEELIAEDLVLYEAVMARLAGQDGLSIRGRVFG